MMKLIRTIVSVILLVMICGLTTSTAQDIRKVKINEVIQMIDTSSTPLIINFWASWCKPCIHELEYFESIAAEYKSKGVKLVLVSLDFEGDYKSRKLYKFVRTKGYTSEVVWLNETNADAFCPPIDANWGGSIPATLMVNNSKKYRQFYEFQLREERYRLEVEKLVE